MATDQQVPKPWSQIFLGVVAVLLFVSAIAGSFNGLDDKVVGGVIGAGVILAGLAAFFPRIQGVLKLGKNIEIPVAASDAEKQIKQGRVVDEDELEAAMKALEETLSRTAKAIEETLSRHNAPQVGTPTVTQGPPSPKRRSVALVDDAVVAMVQLEPSEQVRVRKEIARMSRPDFREEDDPRAIRAGDQGRSYRVHRVPETNLRLWYRPLSEDQP
jgi:hypothetical protein